MRRSMSKTAEKARALRVERLTTMLATRIEKPEIALEALLLELADGALHDELWEGLHAGAIRDGKEPELAAAYRKVATGHRLDQLAPAAQVEVFMHAADFFQGVLGDGAGAEQFLQQVLEHVPTYSEAFARLERRYNAAHDNRRLVELYATAAASPPKPADELARTALNLIVHLPAQSPLSDEACKRLLAFLPHSPTIVDVLETHCKKTGRAALACALLEQAIGDSSLPETSKQDLRRRLVDLYDEAGTPERSIAHVEQLLVKDPSDSSAREAAERLLAIREVASRAAAALQQARRDERLTE